MNRFFQVLAVTGICAAGAWAADPSSPPVSRILDQQVTNLERELVPLAQAMPAAKYNFRPTGGEFATVRTFGQQVSHIAAVIYACASSVLGEPNPTQMGEHENGPPALKTKDDMVNYLKDAFAYAHKAMGSVNDRNLTGMVKSPFGEGQTTRLSMATTVTWHSFDHYGQMVVYARMNGIVPPASRR